MTTVLRAAAQGLPLVDYGKAHRGVGHPPPAECLAFEQTGAVIEHYERDMTVRVAAGATLDQVHAVLAGSGQFLPIDADGDLTLGEIVMHNGYGPLRLTYGTMRDLLLGLRYVDADGRDIHVGGRTVKNVAGYDVTKLMVGSLGELGLVYEMTLRTYAIPPQIMAVSLNLARPEALDRRVTDLLTCEAAPTWLALSRRDGAWCVDLAYAGSSTACAAQLRSLQTFVDSLPDVRLGAANTHDFAHDLRRRRGLAAWRRGAGVCLKLIVPPARTGQTCGELLETCAVDGPMHLDALPAHGCIFVGGDLTAAQGRDLDAAAARIIGDGPGLRVWYARPREAMDLEPVAPRPADYDFASAIKAAMDPHGRFNPGRYLTLQPGEAMAR